MPAGQAGTDLFFAVALPAQVSGGPPRGAYPLGHLLPDTGLWRTAGAVLGLAFKTALRRKGAL